METLNKVELKGIVGNSTEIVIEDERIIRFSVATSYAYKNKKGEPTIETTWHGCTAWCSKCPDAVNIKKGAKVHLTGRLQVRKHINTNGTESTQTEIIVNSLEIINE